jgi:hypothetical protein
MKTRKTKASIGTKLLYMLVRHGFLIGFLTMIFVALMSFTLLGWFPDMPDWVYGIELALIVTGPVLFLTFGSFQDDPFWAKKLPRDKYGRYISPFLDDDDSQFDERGE